MKISTIKKLITACLIGCCVSAINAKDIYISATGDDLKDGLSAANAVKTLEKINTIVEKGDIIHIKGSINLDNETASLDRKTGIVYIHSASGTKAGFCLLGGNWDSVTFLGENNLTDGFFGNDNMRLFFMDGGTYTFENLFFKGGRVLYSDGGHVVWCRNTTSTYNNCVFEENKAGRDPEDPSKLVGTNGRGGVFRIMNKTATFNDCLFVNNENTLGSGIFIEGGTVNIAGCTFEDNDASGINNSQGSAIYTWISGSVGIDLNIDNTLFKGNVATGEGGAIAMKNLTDRPSLVTKVNISNSSFIGNEGQRGGAIILNNPRAGTSDEITITNTTFFANNASSDGGTICLWASQPGSTFTMVNSTVVGNTTNGNAGHGAGIVSMNNTTHPTINLIKKFYNCLFDSNYSLSPYNFSDIWFRSKPGVDRLGNNEVEIKNCFIGWAGTTADNETYPGNQINYCSSVQEDESFPPVLEYANASGIVDESDINYYGQYYLGIPLTDSAPARLYGDASYLTEFGIAATDQFGKPRTIVDEKCVVGAVEVTVAEFDSGQFDEFPQTQVGINPDNVSTNTDLIIIQNGELALASGLQAVFTVYDISGATVRIGNSKLNISDIPSGVYIIKAKSEEGEFTQKIIK